MTRVELPGMDLNEIPESQRVFALQRQLSVLTERLNVALQAIDTDDVYLADGRSLTSYLGLSKEK